MPDLKHVATEGVFVGMFLPAHDEVFDLAEKIGESLDRLRAYITQVRDADQADDAVDELLGYLKAGGVKIG